VLFDITDHPWGGSAPLDSGEAALKTAPKTAPKTPAKAAS
jgi:hypothetical protein